jgi:hypothetical protein
VTAATRRKPNLIITKSSEYQDVRSRDCGLTRSAGERSWLSTLAPIEHTLVDHRRESGHDRIWRHFNIVSLSDMAGTSFA